VRVPNGTVVVTLGAGGAMLAAIVDGAPVERAIRFGNAAGALAATRPGAMPSLPSRAEIDALLSALDA